MDWFLTYAILAIPLTLNILAILIYRGAYRKGAILVSPIIALASGFDFYSASQKGNLTGLVTMIVCGPMLIVLLLLGLGNVAVNVWPGSSKDPSPTSRSDAKIYNATALGAVAGSAIGGLLFGGPAGFVGGFLWPALGLGDPNWVRTWTIGNAAWYLGAVFGTVVGAAFGWIRGLWRRP